VYSSCSLWFTWWEAKTGLGNDVKHKACILRWCAGFRVCHQQRLKTTSDSPDAANVRHCPWTVSHHHIGTHQCESIQSCHHSVI
jgi:hypothetical protein